MDVFREIRYITHLFFILLLCWLGWLSALAFGQLDAAFTGSANFSNIQLTCLGNSVAFFTVLLRGKLWCRDIAQITLANRKSEQLKNINGLEVVTTCREELRQCSVVILSFQRPTTHLMGLRSWIRYISNSYDAQSIFLQYYLLQSVAVTDTLYSQVQIRMHCIHGGSCGCIIFNTVEDVIMMLARRMPGTLKRLSDSLSLLPSVGCLRNGCHGCNQGLLHVENDRLRERDSTLETPAAVCEILDSKSIHTVRTCICIPVRSANDDEWTKQLVRFFEPGDKDFRGAVIRNGRINASSAVRNYINGNGECDADEKYNIVSLIIFPRFSMIFITLVLTFWLKVDGFSSALFAHMAARIYISVKDYELSPHRVLSRALVKSNANKTNVCQVLFCAGALHRLALSYSLSHCVNSVCIISWVVLVALEGGANKWYHTHSMEPSKPRIGAMSVGIFIALVMDSLDLSLYWKIRKMPSFRCRDRKITFKICAIISLEIVCIVACSAIAVVPGINASGRWIYSALQCLVCVKWLSGFFLFDRMYEDSVEYGSEPTWWYGSCGLYIIASGLLLNAILAGVRADWKFE